jgi:hypothetical protein
MTVGDAEERQMMQFFDLCPLWPPAPPGATLSAMIMLVLWTKAASSLEPDGVCSHSTAVGPQPSPTGRGSPMGEPHRPICLLLVD